MRSALVGRRTKSKKRLALNLSQEASLEASLDKLVDCRERRLEVCLGFRKDRLSGYRSRRMMKMKYLL